MQAGGDETKYKVRKRFFSYTLEAEQWLLCHKLSSCLGNSRWWKQGCGENNFTLWHNLPAMENTMRSVVLNFFSGFLFLEPNINSWMNKAISMLLCWHVRAKIQRKEVIIWILKYIEKIESEIGSVMSNSLPHHGLYSPWDSPGQNTGVDNLTLLLAILPTQRLNPGLPHCRWILYQLSHKGSPMEKTAFLLLWQIEWHRCAHRCNN